MPVPYISIALILGSIYLIKIGQAVIGIILIGFIILINIVIQFVKGGGLDVFKKT